MNSEIKSEKVTFYPSPNLRIVKCSEEFANFAKMIYVSYNQHNELEFGPDHVWACIMSSFSTYVNENAEIVRDSIVSFQNKKDLILMIKGSDIDNFKLQANGFNRLISANVKDPELVSILVPKFSTSTESSQFAFGILCMSTVKKYFTYKCQLMCGLPKVTMNGNAGDYRLMIENLKKLLKYDNPQKYLELWFKYLIPVLEKFAESFTKPDLNWWNQCCTDRTGGSFGSEMSGWLAVFNPYDSKNKYQFETPFMISNKKVNYPVIDYNEFADNYGEADVHYYDEFGKYMYTRTFKAGLKSINKKIVSPELNVEISDQFQAEPK